MKSPVALIILDGWGISPSKDGNAIYAAKTPNFNRLATESTDPPDFLTALLLAFMLRAFASWPALAFVAFDFWNFGTVTSRLVSADTFPALYF